MKTRLISIESQPKKIVVVVVIGVVVVVAVFFSLLMCYLKTVKVVADVDLGNEVAW